MRRQGPGGVEWIYRGQAVVRIRLLWSTTNTEQDTFAKTIQIQPDDEATSSQSRQQGDETPKPQSNKEATAPQSSQQEEQTA